MSSQSVAFRALGDLGLCVEFGDQIDLPLISRCLRSTRLPG